MIKSSLIISNKPPEGWEWSQAWQGEASLRYLDILKTNFENIGFKIHVQLLIAEGLSESKRVERTFLYKIYVNRTLTSRTNKTNRLLEKL